MGFPKEDGMVWNTIYLKRFRDSDPMETLKTAASAEAVLEAQNVVTSVRTSEAVQQYIVDIIEATRHDSRISLGVSPRGSIALMKAAQVNAVLDDRDYITPDDVKKMAVPVLAHRLIIKGHAIAGGTENAEKHVRDILGTVRVPTEEI
jgi:MoxR-like ATPase